jgi:hypothetical protein
MMKKVALLLAFACIGTSGAAQAGTLERYQPTIDITKDPQCGQKRLVTKEERIANNRMLAELYYVNFQQDRARGENLGWWTWNCMADQTTVLLGAVEPLGTPHVVPGRTARNPREHTGEQLGYFATFKDWGTIPNTLTVVPFEDGAFFRMMYGGHDDAGKYFSIWETNLILVNDEGKITHFELWNDTIGWAAAHNKIFGSAWSPSMGLGAYIETTESFKKRNPNK